MKNRPTRLTMTFPRSLLIIALLASLFPLSLYGVSVANAPSKTEAALPMGSASGGQALPELPAATDPGRNALNREPPSGAAILDGPGRRGAGSARAIAEVSPIAGAMFDSDRFRDETMLLPVNSANGDGNASFWSKLTESTAFTTLTMTQTRTLRSSDRLPAPTLAANETETNEIELSWTKVAGAAKHELSASWSLYLGWQVIALHPFA